MARRGLTLDHDCLWKGEYANPSAENAFKFVCNLRSWNEAAKKVQYIPDREYIKKYCFEWWQCYTEGRPMATEKCRRMVISWVSRGLELYVMGLGRCDQILAGEDLEAAAKHVWRIKHLYTDLRARMPEWKLPPHSELKYEGEKKLKQFSLPNGSTCSYANGQSSGLQGDGTSIITMEEGGIYRYLQSMLAQAKIITQGEAGATKGFVNIITNSSTNEEWQEVKRGGVDESVTIELEPLMRGMSATILPTGMRYIRLQHDADPDKDDAWLEEVRAEMADTPKDFRLQILMDDAEDMDAIWSNMDIDPYRIPLALAPDFSYIVIALDPAVKGDHPGCDETGIIVAGVAVVGEGHDAKTHAYVIGDFSGQHSPEKTARIISTLADRFKVSEILYEDNQGGEWIPALIKTEFDRIDAIDPAPMVPVNVHTGKAVRAEPTAARYRHGVVHHITSSNSLYKLEKQMTGWNPRKYNASPGRLDALVIALHRIFNSDTNRSKCSSTNTFMGYGKKRKR